jgi:hypothetical protein
VSLTILRRGACARAPFPFFDAFTRADSSSTLGDPWTALSGTWGISSNKAYAPSAGVAAVNYRYADMKVTATVGVRDDGSAVLARIKDANNFYMVLCGPSFNQNVLYKCIGGSFTLLAAAVNGSVNGDIIRLTVIATAITVHRNGSLIISATDTALGWPTATRAGLRADTASARFDDFSVLAP